MYTVLPPDHFRLLTLHSGSDDDLLRCSLTPVSIEASPKYEAVSYEWGPPDAWEGVCCGGVTASITTNAAAALRLFRSPVDRILWMDQLCINQADLEERRQKVQLMYKIFGGASRVLTWLGQDCHGMAPIVLEFMNELKKVWRQPFDNDIPDLEKRLIAQGVPRVNSVKWEAYRTLMGLPYFP